MTNCAMPPAMTSCRTCGGKPSPSATTNRKRRCRCGSSVPSCPVRASAAPACTGMASPGDGSNGITRRARRTVDKYGEKIIPADMNLQDWPITYDDLEPYYDKFEKTCGTSGKAGNLNGQKIDGGNVFEGPRKSEYPNPPLIAAQNMVMFEKAARNLGYHPFPEPRVKRFAGLRQSRWSGLRPVPLLRLLRALRLRSERQGEPALHCHSAGHGKTRISSCAPTRSC